MSVSHTTSDIEEVNGCACPTPVPTSTETPTPTPTDTPIPTNTETPTPTPTPTAVPIDASNVNLQIWYDGSDIAQFQPTNPSDGTTITQWNDKSAIAHNANPIGGSTGVRPSYEFNELCGQSGVWFDGTDGLSINPITELQSLTGMTVSLVVRLDISLLGQQQHIILSSETSGGNYNDIYLFRESNGQIYFGFTFGGSNYRQTQSPVITDSNAHLITMTFNGNSTDHTLREKLWIDGVSIPLQPITTLGSTTPFDLNKVYLGTNPLGTAGMNGYIFEMLVFDKELSSSERSSVENQLNDKWFVNCVTATPLPTSTNTPTPTDTPIPTSTSTPLPTATPQAWSPSNDILPVAWIDASDSSNYQRSGTSLLGVTDKAGTYTMSIGGNPVTNSSTQNGLNVFDFDGSDFLQSTLYRPQVSGGGNHFALGVFRFESTNNDKNSFWSYETNGSPKRDYAISAGATNNTWPGELDMDGLSSNRISNTIGNLQVWNFKSCIQNQYHIVSCWFNKTGNQIGVRVDGSNAFTPVNDYTNSIQTNQELRLMRNRASVELDGKMGEFIAYASMPGTSGTDMTYLEKAEGYLAHKWGLTNSLPSSHPYKNSPPTV